MTSSTGRTTRIALLAAAAWGVGLMIAGFVVPVYETSTASQTGVAAQGTATLVGANGISAAFVLAIPLLATALVAGSLQVPDRRAALGAAWTLTALLLVGNLLAMLTVGIFVLPLTVALVVASATASRAVPVAVT